MRRTRSRKSRHNRPVHPEQLESRSLFAASIAGTSTTYATIQAAVDAAAPGATINVEAGTYSEWVYVDKKLTIRGAQAGVDARSNLRAGAALPETIVNGINLGATRSGAFHVVASGVTIDGFVVQGNTDPSVSVGAGIVMAPKISGTKIFNNIIQNNVSGIYLSNNSSTTPAVIQRNLFRYNNNPGVNSGRAIYSDEYISGFGLTNITIDNNAFIRNYGGSGTTTVESAVAFESYTAGVQSNLRITNNVFDANGKCVLAWNAQNILIENNVASYTKDQWSGVFRFEGNVQDVIIRNNTAYGNPGPVIRIDSKASAGENSGFSINYNNFFRNDTAYTRNAIELFAGQYSGTLDARNNYWGNSGGPGAGDADTYDSGGVPINVSPWLTAPVGQLQSPFYGIGYAAGAKIEAEDFDHGGAGVAYNDSDIYNSGGQWRNTQYADVERTTDTGGGYNLGWTRAGEWLEYTVNLATTGTYNLDIRLASQQTTGGTFHVEIDGVDVTGPLTAPNTGAWQTWTTLTKTGLSIPAGTRVLRLVFDTNGSAGAGANVNWLKLTSTTVTPPPPIPPPNAPSALVASANASNQVILTWLDNSSNESGFIIERRTGTGAWQLLATTTANIATYTDNTVAAGTTYAYRLRATNSSGDSPNSNESTVITPATQPPPQSSTYLSDLPWLSMTNGWGPAERDLANGGSSAGDGAAITLNGVTYTKGLGVHAASEIVYSLNGAYAQFISDLGVDDRQTTNGSIVFLVYADGALIYDSGVMTPTTPTKTVTLNVTAVQQLKLIVNDAGDGNSYDHGDWAGARLIASTTTTPPPPPPGPTAPAAASNLTVAALSSTSIRLNWKDNSTDETGFKVYRSTDGITWILVATLDANTTTWTNTGLSSNRTYYYRVAAFNAVGSSPFSNTVSAKTPKRSW